MASPLELVASTVPPPPGSLQKVRFIKGVVNKDSLKIKKPYPFVFVLDLTDFLPEFIDDDLVVEDLKIITYLFITYLFICLSCVIKNMQ